MNQLKAKSHTSDSVQHAINYIEKILQNIDISEVAKEVGIQNTILLKIFNDEYKFK